MKTHRGPNPVKSRVLRRNSRTPTFIPDPAVAVEPNLSRPLIPRLSKLPLALSIGIGTGGASVPHPDALENLDILLAIENLEYR